METLFNNVCSFLTSLSMPEIVSYIIGLGGIVITLIAYLRTRRTQRPKYLISSATLRNEVFDDSSFEIMQGDRSLPSLTLSKFALWNTGITLTKEDIAAKDPIHITTDEDVEILEVQKVYAEPENNFEFIISEDKKTITFSFDYFAKKQGVVLKIFHTGKNSNSLNVKGSLKNGKKITRTQRILRKILLISLPKRHISFTAVIKIYAYIFGIYGLTTSAEAIFRYGTTHQYGMWETIWSVASGLLVVITCLYLIRRRLPAKLEKAFYGEN